ncbi:putative non-ribosomal peptide synthase-like protein [Phyllosticta citrichinensis]|uniref:Non-ribosomal peptide synthase-like protein n=1 Tax=Phyllosticta citrichinensis TaxID=1130410 RepID=A0ABR1XLE8_9PEZI
MFTSLAKALYSISPWRNSDDPQTVLQLLQRAAKKWPTHTLSFKTGGWEKQPEVFTYEQLLREALTNAAKLRQADIIPEHRRIVLYFDNHRDNCIWYWSVIAAGGVPALLSPLSNNQTTLIGELENVNKTFSGPTILTTKSLAKYFVSIQGMKTVTVQSVQLEKLEAPIGHDDMYGGGWFDEGVGREDEVTTMLFTSGSTGYAKAVQYTHRQLCSSSKIKCGFHNTNNTQTFMSWVSFDHSAALCENHLHAVYAGASQVMIPAIDLIREPVRFWQALSEFKVGFSFAPNFFVSTAARAYKDMPAEERWKLDFDFSELRTIMCGGEANKKVVFEAGEEILTKFGAPRNAIKSAYGLSETCSAIFYNTQCPTYDVKRRYVFASVGKLLPQHQMRILDEDQKPVKHGSVGSLQLKGAMVFNGYFNNDSANAGCMTSDGWFDTGDQTKLDDQGNLIIVGRSKEIIIINGQNYSSFELEHAIETEKIPGISPGYIASFAVWGTKSESDTEDMVILFNPMSDATQDSPELRSAIASINETCIRFCRKKPSEVIPLPKELMPKSTIGKLSRAKLKKSYQAGCFDQYKLAEKAPEPRKRKVDGEELATPLQKVIEKTIVQETGIDPMELHLDLPMADLGIESLGYLRIKSRLEKELESEDPISMALFLACRTIRDVDMMLLSLGTVTPEYDPIVPLVTSGSKTPLILCHPGGGEFLTWLPMLPYIPNRRVLALRVRGFHKGEESFKTLDEMLEIYVDGIKKHQPEGPYAFLGLCFGGMLAYELTKRFESMGEEVVFCGGIDNPADLRRIATRNRGRNFFIDLLHFFQILDHETALRWEEEMEHIPESEFTAAIFARFPDGTLENLDLTYAKVETWQRINQNLQDITRAYEPTGKISKFDLFWVNPLPHFNCTDEVWRHEWLCEWKDYVEGASQKDVEQDDSPGPLRYHRVQGTHFTILRPENIDVFQKALNRALETRGV